MIFADLFVPGNTEARHTPSVGSNDNVSVCRHQLKVPAERIELREGRLRSALAIQKRWIFPCGIKIGRIYNPHQHLFSVCCSHTALFNFTQSETAIDVVV